ncbi:hypothetical protein FB451DRAFT_44613 [Mycena latifolia]|nr:hypothetical protein FB451DRAFT_44613 [Mycena latifolia]
MLAQIARTRDTEREDYENEGRVSMRLACIEEFLNRDRNRALAIDDGPRRGRNTRVEEQMHTAASSCATSLRSLTLPQVSRFDPFLLAGGMFFSDSSQSARGSCLPQRVFDTFVDLPCAAEFERSHLAREGRRFEKPLAYASSIYACTPFTLPQAYSPNRLGALSSPQTFTFAAESAFDLRDDYRLRRAARPLWPQKSRSCTRGRATSSCIGRAGFISWNVSPSPPSLGSPRAAISLSAHSSCLPASV